MSAERPILFSGPMVRAILAGTKTQTRRVVKSQPLPFVGPRPSYLEPWAAPWKVGDTLWVRETWKYSGFTEDGYPFVEYAADNARVLHEKYPEDWAERLNDTWAALSLPENYNIDNRAADRRWRPGIHLSRWAARLLLHVSSVRAERLQEISDVDVEAEELPEGDWYRVLGGPVKWYQTLWDSLNAERAPWSSNPWVWVVEFVKEPR